VAAGRDVELYTSTKANRHGVKNEVSEEVRKEDYRPFLQSVLKLRRPHWSVLAVEQKAIMFML
jgi:hypothetical protein